MADLLVTPARRAGLEPAPGQLRSACNQAVAVVAGDTGGPSRSPDSSRPAYPSARKCRLTATAGLREEAFGARSRRRRAVGIRP